MFLAVPDICGFISCIWEFGAYFQLPGLFYSLLNLKKSTNNGLEQIDRFEPFALLTFASRESALVLFNQLQCSPALNNQHFF